MADTNERNWLSVAEVARLLGVSRTTVWRWIRAGHLPAHRIGPRTLRVERGAVDALGARKDLASRPDETAGVLSDEEADAMIAYIHRGRDESLALEIERDRERGWLYGNGDVAEEGDGELISGLGPFDDDSLAAEHDDRRPTLVNKEVAARKRAALFATARRRAALPDDAAERAAIKRAALFANVDSARSRAILDDTLGSLPDLDDEAMVAYIYRGRDESAADGDAS